MSRSTPPWPARAMNKEMRGERGSAERSSSSISPMQKGGKRLGRARSYRLFDQGHDVIDEGLVSDGAHDAGRQAAQVPADGPGDGRTGGEGHLLVVVLELDVLAPGIEVNLD